MNASSGHSNPELRVLALPTTRRDLELTSSLLADAGIECVGCSGPGELCDKMREGVGAILLAEETLADDVEDLIAKELAAQPPWSDLPLLVLARPGADSARVGEAMDRFGNVTVLERPLRIVSLVSAVKSALRARERQYEVREDAKKIAAARDELEIRVEERTRELSESEKRAHQLMRELVAAQENERARIARDLHDELGQQLTSLRLHLSQIDRELPKGAKSRNVLGTIVNEVARIDSRVSFLAWMIRPSTIEEMGLAKAIRGYVREWSRNFDIAAEFRAGKIPTARLLPEIEVNVYRIAQECLNNVAKYADADHVNVLLTIGKDELTLIVEDDGKGFDVASATDPSSGGGLGLTGMRERAALLQGTFDIESSSAGTTAYIRLPAKYR